MRKKLVAAAVSLAVLFVMAARADAGTVLDGSVASKQAVLDKNDGALHLRTAKKDAGKAVPVSFGNCFCGVLTEDGSLYVWGRNYEGQLGDGTNEDRDMPVKVLENVESVSLADEMFAPRSGAVTKDGSLYTWGCNYEGQLGDGTNEGRNMPVKVLENVESVSFGNHHSGAVTKDGSLYMWGGNDCGQLGDGSNKNRNIPVKVLENVESVSLGYNYSGAVTKDGSLYMWGNNYAGQLGDGSNKNRNIPVKVLDHIESVSLAQQATTSHSGAVAEDGSLYMWGSNDFGKLGDGTNEDRNMPVKVLENVESVSLEGDYSVAVMKDGRLYTWGENSNGQLGEGSNENRNIPVKVLDHVKSISLAMGRIGAVVNDGGLYTWGDMHKVATIGGMPAGLLGDSSTEGRNIPVKVLDNAAFVSVGMSNIGAVMRDGSLYMWGMDVMDSTTGRISTSPVKIDLLPAQAAQKITYCSDAIKKGKVTYGSAFSLNAKTTGAGKLTYKSSNSKILSINANGKAAVKGYGPVSVKIKASGGNGYKAAVRKIKLIAVPGRGKVTKAVQENGAVRIQWKPEKTADGYEYAFAYNKKFSGQSRKKTSKTGLILRKYKTGTKKMYFKVRTYKKAGKKTYYGSWSKVRILKLKKAPKNGESSYTIAN